MTPIERTAAELLTAQEQGATAEAITAAFLDAIRWRDGSLAKGPIALAEVQAYAHEAAMSGAALLEAFGRPGADVWRDYAA